VYTVTPTSGDAGSCVGTNFTITVTVNPTPVIANKTSTICSGTAFTITPSNSGSEIVPTSTTYTWTVAPNADVTGETDQAVGQSNISQTLTNTSNTVQTVVYTVTPRSGAAGNCVGSTFTVTVTVNPRPTIDVISNQAVCAGSTVSGVTITGSVASTVYTRLQSILNQLFPIKQQQYVVVLHLQQRQQIMHQQQLYHRVQHIHGQL